MWKPDHRKVKKLAQGHETCERQNPNINPFEFRAYDINHCTLPFPNLIGAQ